MADVSILNGVNGANTTSPVNEEKPKIEIEEKEIDKTEETKKVLVEIPDEKKEKNIIQTTNEGDTLSISETGDKLRQLKELETKPILVAPEKTVETEDVSADTDETTDILNNSGSSDNLSTYSELELKRMLDRGEITSSEYNLELANRKAQGTLEKAEQKVLDTEEKLAKVEGTNGQSIEDLVNGKYGASK